MKQATFFGLSAIAALLVGCGDPTHDYIPASTLSQNGFARNDEQVRRFDSQTIQLWGFVDHGNIYGDASAKGILQEWWSGDGPTADTWRFNLKGHPNDAIGRSFSVRVPNDAGRDQLLRAFLANARAGRPTKVFVKGKLGTFDAPTNASSQTGLYMEVQSSQDILLNDPAAQ